MRREWEDNEIQYLHDMYYTYTVAELATQLDRSYASVKMKLEKENIKLPADIIAVRRNVLGIHGCGNHNWKGGISKNNYHYKKLQKERYPEKVKARKLVYDALKRGILIKHPCELCGCLDVQAHHEDYSKPLNIRWLCKKCHDEWHRQNTPTYSGYIGTKETE